MAVVVFMLLSSNLCVCVMVVSKSIGNSQRGIVGGILRDRLVERQEIQSIKSPAEDPGRKPGGESLRRVGGFLQGCAVNMRA